MKGPVVGVAARGRGRIDEATASKAMIVLMVLLIAGASMAFAVNEWWRGHHMMAGSTFALVIAGVAIEAAKRNHRGSPAALGRRARISRL